MLQLSQSAKRIGKLKKYKCKAKESGFQFLLQSLDRDKENLAPNLSMINHNHLARSIHIDPLLTAPVYSYASGNQQQGNREKGKFYLENVKLLDRSDVSLTEMDQSAISKKSFKGRENSNKGSRSRGQRKEGNRNISNRSKQSEGEQFQELMYKMKLYLSITDDLIDEVDTSKWKYAKKARQISQELTSLLAQAESEERDRRSKMNLSVKTTSFNMFGSEIIGPGKESQSFARRINGLQEEKEKLSNLVSQHEMANIKMFVKINQGDSEEIQQCKKDAARLFQNYKKLQRIIKAEKKKLTEALAEKEELLKGNEQLRNQNEELLILVEKYQLALQKQNHPKKGILKVSILQPERQNSYPSYQPSELHIESLQNSCNSSGFQEDIGLSSSIITNTSRINKKGGKLGINLNALLDNLTQNEVQRLAASPQKLKRTMKQCRETIIKMQSIINEQNKELELSIKTLEAFQTTMNEKDQQIHKLDLKIIQLENQMARLSKEKKAQDSKPKKPKKQQKQKVEIDERGCVTLDTNFKKGRFDEYRIIATQAMALEQAIRNKQIK